MGTNQISSKQGWKWVLFGVIFAVFFLGFLAYSVSSDNKEINGYAKQWRSTGDKEASMPMDMSNMNHDQMNGSEMKNTDMSKMNHDGMSASEMQHMDMSDMQHEKKSQ